VDEDLSLDANLSQLAQIETLVAGWLTYTVFQ
jgi:hypothetical protein